MPEISRFLGIVIRMYYRDHAPPHFHATYGDYDITVDIETGVPTAFAIDVVAGQVRHFIH